MTYKSVFVVRTNKTFYRQSKFNLKQNGNAANYRLTLGFGVAGIPGVTIPQITRVMTEN